MYLPFQSDLSRMPLAVLVPHLHLPIHYASAFKWLARVLYPNGLVAFYATAVPEVSLVFREQLGIGSGQNLVGRLPHAVVVLGKFPTQGWRRRIDAARLV